MTRVRNGTGLRRLLQDERGAAALEFGLLVSLVSVATIGAYQEIGETLGAMFDDIAMILETVNGRMTEGIDFAG